MTHLPGPSSKSKPTPSILGPASSHLLCILLLLALVSGCDGDARTSVRAGWRAVVDTVGDTIRVRTVAGSVWRDTATLVPEMSIGAMDGEDAYVLGQPRGLGVTAEGNVLLLDAQVPVLRMYGPDGIYLRDIGRDGSGPGEYASPDGFGLLPDGRILVRDPPNGRISVFDGSGVSLGQWPLSGGFNSEMQTHVDTRGHSYVITLLSRGVDPWDWEFGLVHYSPSGEILDTLAAPTWDFDFPRLTASGEHSRSVSPVPFSPTVSWTFSPLGYLVGGLSTEYRIDLFHPDGTVLRIERDWTPVPVSPAEAELQRRRVTQRFQRQYGSWGWNGPDIPGQKPPFKEIIVSREGNLWVSLSTEGVPILTEAEAREEEAATGRVPQRFREPVAFDVFSPDGEYLGPVTVPETFRAEPEPVIRGDYIWAVTRDELDVPRVVRFRIQTS